MIRLAYTPGAYRVILEGVNFRHSNFGDFYKDGDDYYWIPNNLGGIAIKSEPLREIADALDKLNANKPGELNPNQVSVTP